MDDSLVALVRATIEKQLSDGNARIVLIMDDFALNGDVDTQWIATLAARARTQGGGIGFVSARREHHELVRILKQTGLLPRVFGFFETLRDAERAFAEHDGADADAV